MILPQVQVSQGMTQKNQAGFGKLPSAFTVELEGPSAI